MSFKKVFIKCKYKKCPYNSDKSDRYMFGMCNRPYIILDEYGICISCNTEEKDEMRTKRKLQMWEEC